MKKNENQLEKVKQETAIARASFSAPEELKTNISDTGISTIVPYIGFASSGKITLRDVDSGEEKVVSHLEGTILLCFKTTILRRAAAWPQKTELLAGSRKNWSQQDLQVLAMAYGNSEGNIDGRFFSNKTLRDSLDVRTNIIFLTKTGKLVRLVSGKTLNTKFKRYAQNLAMAGNDSILVSTIVEPLVTKNSDGEEFTTFSFRYEQNLAEDYFNKNIMPAAKVIKRIIDDTQKYYENQQKVWSSSDDIETGRTVEISVSEDSVPMGAVMGDDDIPF
jgi:hypothetical protein